MRLRSAGFGPPTTTSVVRGSDCAPKAYTPRFCFEPSVSGPPCGVVPRKLPAIVTEPVTWIVPIGQRLKVRPWMRPPPAAQVRQGSSATAAPLTSMFRTALVPCVSGAVFTSAPGCV